MKLELVTFNLRVPWILDTTILEVMASGLWIMLEQHKDLGLALTETSVFEHAKLTMGDHAVEVGDGTDDNFEYLYGAAVNGINMILAAQEEDIKLFATWIDGIKDIQVYCYPGLIRLCVDEKKKYDARYFELLLS